MSLVFVQKKPMNRDGRNLHAFYFDGSPGSFEEAQKYSKGFEPILNSEGNFSGRMKFIWVNVMPCQWVVLETQETFSDDEFRGTFDFLGKYDFKTKDDVDAGLCPVMCSHLWR